MTSCSTRLRTTDPMPLRPTGLPEDATEDGTAAVEVMYNLQSSSTSSASDDDEEDRFDLAKAQQIQLPANWLTLKRDPTTGHVSPPVPENEDQRLNDLYKLEIMEPGGTEALDRISKLCARVFDSPVAVVNLIFSELQVFPAEVGLGTPSLPRNGGICPWTIMQKNRRGMVINDTLMDPRTMHNPFVEGAPGIRFYAGAPLICLNGTKLGTLCVIDFKPRTIDADQYRTLIDFSDVVMDELELRLARRQAVHSRQYVLSTVERLQYSVNVLSEGMLMWDGKTQNLLFTNRGFYNLTGFDFADIRGEKGLQFIFGEATEPKDQQDLRSTFDDMTAICTQRTQQEAHTTFTTAGFAADGVRLECILYRKDGSSFWAEVSLSLSRNTDSGTAHVLPTIIGVIIDISPKIMAKHAQQRAQLAASAAREAKNAFLAGVSHELRFPLTKLVEGQGKLQAFSGDIHQTELVHIIQQSSTQLLDLADAIMDFNKLGDEQLTISKTNVNIRMALQDCTDTLYIKANAKGLVCTMGVDPSVPANLLLDEERFGQVVRNLLSNAISFTREGSVHIQVSSRVVMDNEQHPQPNQGCLMESSGDLSSDDQYEYDDEAAEDTDTAQMDRKLVMRNLSDIRMNSKRNGSLDVDTFYRVPKSRGSPDVQRRKRSCGDIFFMNPRSRRRSSVLDEDIVYEITVRVTDTGIGIPNEMHNRIFKRFGQADQKVTRSVGGVGLGLIVSKKLAKLMDGKLALERSVPDKGSTFSFTLRTTSPLVSAKRATPKIRILVVDSAQEGPLIKLLSLLGHKLVNVASNGADVLQHLRNGRRYDLILLTYQLSDMTSIECQYAISNLRLLDCRPFVVALQNWEPEPLLSQQYQQNISPRFHTNTTPPTSTSPPSSATTTPALYPNEADIEWTKSQCKEAGLAGLLHGPAERGQLLTMLTSVQLAVSTHSHRAIWVT
eukprot:TRINITY_DN4212_c0_g1_i2.p1 TRINITY_DN4212_c0_g1~~TRINITY_DN4212_c0_g1_i2.p1  ORF type:complete len:949 (+),score=123.15 TRINITY_DN4212_c0_g1_i2:479-3325(+)